ncbi:LysE family translocator [Vibrio furnissii]|uniref:LysE family translocator n=2 Tax=Vibrio furnissii TaxID=29494 RepID=UPI001E3A249B|nr:LysE family translocator [Vibrio furnissii]MCG6215117.1 LysE family translocator [Vibrio furnissii]UHJ58858.1 LysE family translocator [Vibrio furnissii]WJG20311.1 LysE family translocator [Vibrio furnissii]WJG24807.1 LysE family translocator [Vibrio furnissii]
MMVSLLSAMALFAFVGAVSPGPVNVMATYAGAQFGWRKASIHVLGASVAYVLVVFICGVALGEMSQGIPLLVPVMRWVGSLYLLYLAVRILLAKDLGLKSNPQMAMKALFVQGSLIQLLNPKAWIFASSGVSLYVLNQVNTHSALGWFCSLSLVICFIGVGVWAVLGQSVAQWLNSPRRQRWFQLILAAMLCVSMIIIWM